MNGCINEAFLILYMRLYDQLEVHLVSKRVEDRSLEHVQVHFLVINMEQVETRIWQMRLSKWNPKNAR